MSLPDLDDVSTFTLQADAFLASRKALIERLVAEKDIAALSRLLEEDHDNLSTLHTELNTLRTAVSNVTNMSSYEES